MNLHNAQVNFARPFCRSGYGYPQVIPGSRKGIISIGWIAVAAFTALCQNEPVATFGTTVVDTAGFRGTIYFLDPKTGILPDTFHRFKPKGTIYTRSLNVPPRNFREGFPGITRRFEWFAIDYEGRFWIRRAGIYRFALTSDDGSLLFVDSDLVIDNDRIHPPQTKEGQVSLNVGAHDIRVAYFQGPRDQVALILRIAGPGEELRVFSMDEFRPYND